MKKFILSLMVMLTVMLSSANAQIAYQKADFLDNVYVGLNGGVSSPLDFNSVTPFNAQAGVKVGKNWSPVFGTNIEGTAVFGDNHFADSHTFVKATYVGLNGTLNLTNLFLNYNPDKVFETSLETGFGWIHNYHTSIPTNIDGHANYLGAKTGVILAWNIGNNKAWQLYAEPSVYWNLSKTDKIQFNKHNAQLAVSVGVVYKFKTSNKTHNFKVYNIYDYTSALEEARDRIAALEAQNAELSKRPTETYNVVKETNKETVVYSQDIFTVSFLQNSAELTQDAKNILDKVSASLPVKVIGSTSPEGSTRRNSELSVQRANAVAEYLKSRGVNVISAEGNEHGRIAVVTVVK